MSDAHIEAGWQGRFYEDFTVGDVCKHPYGRTVIETDNVWFTNVTMNVNPMHFNEAYAVETEFDERLVNDTFVIALAVGMSVVDVSMNATANLGYDDIRHHGPVFHRDTIFAESEVLSRRESESRDHVGIVTTELGAYNQNSDLVLSLERTPMVLKREHMYVSPEQPLDGLKASARSRETAMTDRLVGDLPVQDAESVAAYVPADAELVVSGFGSVGAEIDVDLVEKNAVARRFPYQARPPAREAVNDGSIEFHDRNISTLGDEVEFGHLVDADVAIVEALSVGPDWLIPTSSIGQTPAFVAGADELIVELNHSVPESVRKFHDIYRVDLPPNREPIPLTDPGGRIANDRITFDPEKLTTVVETERRDQPYEFRDPTPEDREIAANLGNFLETEVEDSPLFEDSIRIQFGVGSLGNALMSALGDADFDNRDLIYFGEVIQDGLLDLLDNGEIDSASATSLALSRDGQNRLYEHVDRYAEDIVLRPADVSNNPELIARFGVVGVNSALEVDLFGHVNSTHVNGNYAMNGVGGSGDFNRNAAIAVLALPSTAASGDISRVVPMVPHADHTEHDIDIVVTEQDLTDLRGNSPRETAESLVENCAHPDFRDDLREYLDRGLDRDSHIPHHLETAFD